MLYYIIIWVKCSPNQEKQHCRCYIHLHAVFFLKVLYIQHFYSKELFVYSKEWLTPPIYGFSILHSVWQSVTLFLFHLFSSATIVGTQTNSQSAIYSPQMNCLAWEPEVSSLIFLPLCRISMTTDTEITLCAGRGRGGREKRPGWHHTVALLWHMRRAGLIQTNRSRMSIHPPKEGRSGLTEEEEALARDAMWIKPINSEAE